MRIGRWVAASAITVAVVAGLGVRLAHKSSGEGSQAKQALSQLSSRGQTPAAALKLAGDIAHQGVVSNLMTRYRLDSRSAAFIAQAKMQMLGSSNTSLHYLLTFPDGVTSEETITISAARNYKPTAAELQNSKRSGIQIFKPTLSAKKTGPDEMLFTLHYYALRSSLPPDFQQWLQKSFSGSQSARENFFQLVPSAWAQGNGGDNGAESLTFDVIEFVKSMEVHGLENAEMEKSARAMDNLLTVKDLIKGYFQASDWLGEIGELQNCARNPTNPLAIKASQDPDYQKVLNSLDDASSEIQMTALPKVANITASALTQFIPVFGLGVYISPIVDANDEAISEVAEGTIADAKKAVTSCEEMKEPPQKNRGDGSITFHTQLKDFNGLDKYDRFVKGDFELVADPTAGVGAPGRGSFRVKGIGVFTQRSESSQYHTKSKCEAQADIDGHGSEMMGYKFFEIGSHMINGSGDCLMESSGRVYHSSNYQDPGAGCKFTDVDLVNGGNYTAHPEGDPVWSAGTECILQLRPRQK